MKQLCWDEERNSLQSSLSIGTRKVNWQEPATACGFAGTRPEAALLRVQERLGPWSRHLLWSELSILHLGSESLSRLSGDSLSPSPAQLCFFNHAKHGLYPY